MCVGNGPQLSEGCSVLKWVGGLLIAAMIDEWLHKTVNMQIRTTMCCGHNLWVEGGRAFVIITSHSHIVSLSFVSSFHNNPRYARQCSLIIILLEAYRPKFSGLKP